ncbi:MAG: type IV secretory system conjugative DNA transfer family protein, partial [Acidobacteriota bacterium]|nr:type IV secretory system conjugative DNA transfer family protein [Acidobacteriota bacterium]
FPLGGEQGPDPLRLVLGQLAGLADEEEALVQIVARPATVREQRRLLAAAKQIRSGVPTSRALRLLELVLPGPGPKRTPVDPTVSPDVRAVLEKASHPLFRCLVRVSVRAPEKRVARGRMHALAGAFAAYEGRVGLRRRHVLGGGRRLRLRTLGRRGYLLSIPELAALAHLPAEQALPGLLRAGARSISPPPGLPTAGKPLGSTASGSPIVLAVADARYHLHLLGPTGVGKSTLIARLVLDDLAAGRGAIVIDPKGDLVEEILARIPDRLERLVDVFDPLDPQPPGLNVLEGQDHDLVVDQLVGIFRRVYERFWGPRTDDILRAALLTLLETGGGATLADVPRLLTDAHWRAQLLDELEDPVGLEPFWEWYDGMGEAVRAQTTGPVLNKLRAFLLRRPVRAIVGQQHSTIDVARCLDQGRLLVVRVPKGTLGEDTSRLLGSFVVARVWQAALARAAHPESARADCALYVDEVHNYLNLPTPLEEMLAEA